MSTPGQGSVCQVSNRKLGVQQGLGLREGLNVWRAVELREIMHLCPGNLSAFCLSAGTIPKDL